MLDVIAKKLGYRVYPYAQLPWGSHLIASLDSMIDRGQVKTVFDVGANTGQSVFWMRKNFPAAMIHTFEPVPQTYKILERNVRHLSGVKTHAIGVGRENSNLIINEDTSGSHCRSSFKGGDPTNGIEVPVKSIESICEEEEVTSIDFLKIDTEGWEVPVLNGAGKLFEQHRVGMIFIEASLHPERPNQTYLNTLMEWFHSKNYVLSGIFDQQFYKGTSQAAFCNALFVSREWLDSKHA